MKELLRSIPPIHELQQDGRFDEILEETGLDFNQLTIQVRAIIEDIRIPMIKGEWEGSAPGTSLFYDELFTRLRTSISNDFSYEMKRVINATGTVLHTNLGRARLSEEAVRHAAETARNYSNLEFKLLEGERGSRHSHIENLLKKLTGAEAAMVVNNNAAAVYLILRALAENKEVIVSRGQLVEIGGSFRISSIMEESGAKLVEIGTTNKTHLHDYEQAVSESTAMIMKVHTSNFKTIGFTKTVETGELVSLTENLSNVIYYEDLGSGALYDFRKHGIGEEPSVKEIIGLGADLVSFSGDKLLGGPQAGIIAGKKVLIDQLKKHQLARVVRVDKMSLAALEGTLMDYYRGEAGIKKIPVVRDILISSNELESRANKFVEKLTNRSRNYITGIVPTTSQVGGGTMPEVQLPSFAVTLRHHVLTAEQLARKLRLDSSPAVIVRIQNENVFFDLRTVTNEEEELIIDSLLKW